MVMSQNQSGMTKDEIRFLGILQEVNVLKECNDTQLEGLVEAVIGYCKNTSHQVYSAKYKTIWGKKVSLLEAIDTCVFDCANVIDGADFCKYTVKVIKSELGKACLALESIDTEDINDEYRKCSILDVLKYARDYDTEEADYLGRSARMLCDHMCLSLDDLDMPTYSHRKE